MIASLYGLFDLATLLVKEAKGIDLKIKDKYGGILVQLMIDRKCIHDNLSSW